MSEELTRFPITPQERHRTVRSSDDVRAVPEERLPDNEAQPQDKPPPPAADDEERDATDD